ncbi:unnamed protein product [Heterobilharzia americana]|nr:unnamed protein product [Heterobilharzia americana]
MDFLLNLEKYQPQLYVTSIFSYPKLKKTFSLPRINHQFESTSNSQIIQCSSSNSLAKKLNNESNTKCINEYDLTLSNDWSYFLKVHLENDLEKAFLFDISLIPGFKSHGQIKSIKHLHKCHESYHICDFQIIGQYQSTMSDALHDNEMNDDLMKSDSVKNIPNQEDCERLCWAIRQPYTYKNGGLCICDKRYRVLYADSNQSLLAIEEGRIDKTNASTFTATRFQRFNEECINSKEKLQFILLIGFHRKNREPEKCNETIMKTMEGLQRRISCYMTL